MTPDLLWFIHLGLERGLFTLGNAQRALERLPAEVSLERYARHLADDGHVLDSDSLPDLLAKAEAQAAEGGDYGTLALIIETLTNPSPSRSPFPDLSPSLPITVNPHPSGLDELERLRGELAAKEAELEEVRQSLRSRETYLEQCELRLLDRAAALQELEISLEQREENLRLAERALRRNRAPEARPFIAALPPVHSRPRDDFSE
jgi:hypothetical protein